VACATDRGHIPSFFSDALYPTGGRHPPREHSRRSTGIETRGRTRNRVSHPGRGSIGGFAPLGTSLHARNSAFGLGNSDEISDIDAAGVFRGSAESIRNGQSPVGVRIHAAEAGPVSRRLLHVRICALESDKRKARAHGHVYVMSRCAVESERPVLSDWNQIKLI
jgi:hypothetical protein